MADPIKRLNYFEGEFLHADDFNDEQKYHKEMRRLHNSLLHTWGIARGLNLSFAQGASHATISEGVAVDGMGREIVQPTNTETPDLPANKTILVTIAYGEQQTNSKNEAGVTGNTRWTETPIIEVSENPPGDPSQKLILGRVRVGGDGKITNIDEGVEPNRRHSAGVVGGDLEVRSLTLADPNIDPTGWSKMRLGAAGRADVQSSLKIEGDIEVTGKVDGRDVSADGAKFDQHVGNADNPHHTTAAQVGALVSVKAVSNPGGNVDLVPGNTITIAPDTANKRITIGESHSGVIGNPHQTKAADVGALVSVKGVSSPGGNVDLVPGNTVTIAPDAANKRITIGESHSGVIGNPHQTKAADVGALPITGGSINGELTVRTTSGYSSYFWAGQPYNGVRGGVGATIPSSTGWVSGVEGQAFGTYGFGVAAQASSGNYALYVNGTSKFTGSKAGYVVDTFVNRSGQRLRTGEVVKLKGTPVVRFEGAQNRIPVAEVTLVDKKEDNMVIGVVDREAIPGQDVPDTRVGPDDPTFIDEGGELFVVTLGAYSHCKVDASRAPIEVGDLLTSSANPGHAEKATVPKIGSIIGKALEPLKEGTGYIAVFVNIQ